MYYSTNRPALAFELPSVITAALGGIPLVLAGAAFLIRVISSRILSETPVNSWGLAGLLNWLMDSARIIGLVAMLIVSVMLVVAIVLHKLLPDRLLIACMTRRALFCPAYGNPLHFKEGELLPSISCKRVGLGRYELTITAVSCTVDDLVNISDSLSSGLNRKFERYAVTAIDTDVAFRFVTYSLEDVTIDRSIVAYSVDELCQGNVTRLLVDRENCIDLTTSGSMLVAGKTRSGKTTGIISLLLQVLKCGPDGYGSEVIIIDPKRAELSMLPHTVTVGDDGEGTKIVDALSHFEATIVKRQRVLNDLSIKTGDAEKWQDAGFHPSFVFIDEYVSCRSLLPKKAPKGREGYDLDAFDGLLKRIVTMGASAGCFAIVSIAEASVVEGGLPAMLRSAMSTKILFKPTQSEARLMWDAEKVKQMPENRVYNAGDAWFSSTDGVHDFVSNVHFPHMDFPVYKELGRLLSEYYNAPRPPSEAESGRGGVRDNNP